jgi:hypothetical protein
MPHRLRIQSAIAQADDLVGAQIRAAGNDDRDRVLRVDAAVVQGRRDEGT